MSADLQRKKFGGPSWAWLPNSVTGMNLVCGFLAILFCIEADSGGNKKMFAIAGFLVLGASLLDFLDGALAKLTNSASRYGMKMDTFADGVTFGLAPAILVATTLLSGPGLPPGTGWLVALLYFLCAMWRLARFNIQDVSGFGFVGLPSPSAAIFTVSIYLAQKDAPPSPAYVAVIVVLIGLLMICPVRYPAFKRMAAREKYVVFAIVICMYLAMGIYSWLEGADVGIPVVAMWFFGSFAFGWGWMWVPLRHLWNPEVEKQSFFFKIL